jgi:tetratricopeptide (TPR) repeat protein
MSSQSLLALIDQWHENGGHEKIVETLSALPESERDYTTTGLLARALNNMSRYEEALALLESIGEQGCDDDAWHFRMGYSLFYIDGRETEAISYLERAIELGDDYPQTFDLLRRARAYTEKEQSEEESAETELPELEFTPKAYATLSLNMRLQPSDRHDNIEDGLDLALRTKGWGCISGGGTGCSQWGEPEYCDVEIDLVEDSGQMWEQLLSMAQKWDIAKGSKLSYRSAKKRGIRREKEQTVGNMEGVAVYFNGTDLPDEVYAQNDINDVIDTLTDILGDNGALIWSYWDGPQETALYFYGEGGATLMLDKITPFLNEHPLSQKCRIVLLAHEESTAINEREIN